MEKIKIIITIIRKENNTIKNYKNNHFDFAVTCILWKNVNEPKQQDKPICV